jgi:hypothetical protein
MSSHRTRHVTWQVNSWHVRVKKKSYHFTCHQECVTSGHVTSGHVTSVVCHVRTRHVSSVSRQECVTSGHVTSVVCHVRTRHVRTRHVSSVSRQDTSRQDASRQDTSRQDTSRQDTSRHVRCSSSTTVSRQVTATLLASRLVSVM